MPAGMRRIHQLFQFCAQNFHLLVAQNAYALQVPILPEKLELLLVQAVLLPVAGRG